MHDVKFGRLSQAATAILCLGLAGCAATASHQPAAENEIVIGVAGPMTGDLAAFGEQERWGVKTAIADINAAGGLLGKHLRLEIGDDQCDPSRAVSVAGDMVDERASLVVGHFCSGSSIPASEVYATHHIVQITPSSTNPRLTEEGASKGWTTLFRTSSRDDKQGVFAADWFAHEHPTGKIIVIHDGSAYGDAVTQRLITELKVKGITPVATAAYRQRATDFSDLIATIQQSKADIVYIGGYHNDFAMIVRQARAQGVQADFYGADALNTSEFASIAGSAADGVRFSDAAYLGATPAAAKVVAEIRAGGFEPEGYTLSSYAAVQAWAAGVTRANTTEAAKVAAAMRSAPIATVNGEISFDAKGDVQQFGYAWFVWHNGRYAQEHSN
jgi:branched-chain amino acid transport system substrate-binding protein